MNLNTLTHTHEDEEENEESDENHDEERGSGNQNSVQGRGILMNFSMTYRDVEDSIKPFSGNDTYSVER